jgi:hypothetical protein
MRRSVMVGVVACGLAIVLVAPQLPAQMAPDTPPGAPPDFGPKPPKPVPKTPMELLFDRVTLLEQEQARQRDWIRTLAQEVEALKAAGRTAAASPPR